MSSGGSPLQHLVADMVRDVQKNPPCHDRQIAEVSRDLIGRSFAVMSMLVVSELIEEAALLRIEATAKIAR